MNLIFSADRNWGIGRRGELLFRTREDMALFQRMTTGNAVIMGRATLESLPGGRPLPGRDNIVLTRSPDFTCPGAAVCHSLDELFRLVAEVEDDRLFVIGGEQMYRRLLPYAGRAYVTRWEAVGDADRFVPDLDHEPGWALTERSQPRTENGLTFHFCTYTQDGAKNWRGQE